VIIRNQKVIDERFLQLKRYSVNKYYYTQAPYKIDSETTLSFINELSVECSTAGRRSTLYFSFIVTKCTTTVCLHVVKHSTFNCSGNFTDSGLLAYIHRKQSDEFEILKCTGVFQYYTAFVFIQYFGTMFLRWGPTKRLKTGTVHYQKILVKVFFRVC